MRAREIRVMLNGKAESEVILCLTAIAESLSAQQQEISTMAEMMNNLTDILMQLGATVEGATNAVDELKKIRGN
jgi:t-SNARE complex subunit (syntaxin)